MSLMLGEIEGRRRRGSQRVRWLDSITDAMDMNLGKLWEMVKDRGLACCSPWGCKESDPTEQLRLVKTFLPRSKPLLVSWLQSSSAVILEPPKINFFPFFPLFPFLFVMK